MPLGGDSLLNVEEFINRMGEQFSVIRNDVVIGTIRGYRNAEKSPRRNYIGLFPNEDVQDGDILRSEVSQELFHIVESSPDVVMGKMFQRKAYYLTEREAKQSPKKEPVITTYNIHNSPGSIIGSQQTATLHYNTSIHELKALIDKNDTPDKEELNQLVEQLQAIVEGSEQAKGGILARFSEVMQRNSWISNPLGTAIVNWLMHR